MGIVAPCSTPGQFPSRYISIQQASAYTQGSFGHSTTSILWYLTPRQIYDPGSTLYPSRDSGDLADRMNDNWLALSNLRQQAQDEKITIASGTHLFKYRHLRYY